MLEAAIQKGDLGQGGWEAWVLLDEVRSMDEREEAGMRALTEGVKRAEAAGATGEGMLVRQCAHNHRDEATHLSLVSRSQSRSRMNHTSAHHTPCCSDGCMLVIPNITFQTNHGTRSRTRPGILTSKSLILSSPLLAISMPEANSMPTCKLGSASSFTRTGSIPTQKIVSKLH